jgi:predicted RNA-binding protein
VSFRIPLDADMEQKGTLALGKSYPQGYSCEKQEKPATKGFVGTQRHRKSLAPKQLCFSPQADPSSIAVLLVVDDNFINRRMMRQKVLP